MITADHSGIVQGKFDVPEGIPAGVKRVEFIGDRGSRAVTQFTGRGSITVEERRRVRTVERYDPLAQTFTLLDEGRHLAAVGLWFEEIGEKPVTVQIRETANGLPTGVVLAEKRILASEIAPTGEETVIDFPTPLFFAARQEFAIVVLTDDSTHSLAIAEVGQYDRRAQRYVTEQGYTVGVLLSSSNASTWTAHNNADLAFRLYAARFTATQHEIDLQSLAVNNASDLYLLADVERTGSDTDVNVIFHAPDDVIYRLQEKQAASLETRTTGEIAVKAQLSGSNIRSPLLYPGVLAAAGDLQQQATYVSRAISAGSGVALVVLESYLPSGSSMQVDIEINGVWKHCSPQNGEPLGDGWVRNEYEQTITGGDVVRCRITLSGTHAACPKARQLCMITT